MKSRLALLSVAMLQYQNAQAQVLRSAWTSGKFSYFSAGFIILFIAVFVFSYCFKTIVNQKNQNRSAKQILRSSLILAFVIALILILSIYLFLISSLS